MQGEEEGMLYGYLQMSLTLLQLTRLDATLGMIFHI